METSLNPCTKARCCWLMDEFESESSFELLQVSTTPPVCVDHSGETARLPVVHSEKHGVVTPLAVLSTSLVLL